MVGMLYEGAFGTPGIRDILETTENQFWVGRYELQEFTGEIIDGSALDSGNTGRTQSLRAGLLLGKATSGVDEGKVLQWNPAATDGTADIYGVLAHMQNVNYQGSTLDRLTGIMVGGLVDPTKLLIPGQTALGISGNANEFLIRNMMVGSGRFKFYKDFVSVDNGGWRNIVAKTADYTVLSSDHGVLFTNRGAAGAVNFTLPATAYKGMRFGFFVVADQTLTVTSGTADTMVVYNDATADSVSFGSAGDKIGGMFEVVGDGTGWLVMPRTYTDGTIAQTITIVTA
jgi:hypothetical protein